MTAHCLAKINCYLQSHIHSGVLFVFLIAFFESLPVVGTIIPGSVTMSIIGILVGRGTISPDVTLLWASIGALMGDTIGFSIGKHCNASKRLYQIWPFKRYPQWLQMGEDFFKKHGGKSILIGRFVGPVRSSVPLIAGLLKMSWLRFFLAAIPSTIFWATAYLLPGTIFGAASLQLPYRTIAIFLLIGFSTIVLIWLIFLVIQRFFRFFISVIDRTINRLWIWLQCRYSSRFLLQMITNRKIPQDHRQLTMLILAFLSLFFFVVLAVITTVQGPLINCNEFSLYFLQKNLQSKNIDRILIFITMLGDVKVVTSVVLLLLVALFTRGIFRPAAHLAAAILMSESLTFFFKNVVHSLRPMVDSPIREHFFAFPSGHVASSLSVFGFVAFLTAQQISKKWNWVPYTLLIVLIFLISFSRLYLGIHWIEDILGGLSLGFTILLSTIVSYRRYPQETFGDLQWLMFLIFSIVFSWFSFGKTEYRMLKRCYTSLCSVRNLLIEDWWKNSLQYAPTLRTNQFGCRPNQLFFNIQWTDQLDNIAQTLKQARWRETIGNKKDIQVTVEQFVIYKPKYHFPYLTLDTSKRSSYFVQAQNIFYM
ncbi:phosphatase PAP2 family protein [Coxiella endosymbiont of Amblyomma sculptum]|uniref:bifunctional DedA family/phosphatase PAP2 family protein n=1 Tax=Coxiella endosymbiont of Amblyomma sculptum TaxID=2487929 RepID=UPI00132EF0CA|nr:bifunctional DedA family/phosphatase PAP2 family protein [Coxiella endosymbiont of Amblyomma sculptum]QHG92516.1 phosphatase PAP2 family protein [Coxiella endosymbiont of Amblyomma sculptum]